MRIFCVILAKRSERIKDKNFQKIAGKTLIDRCVDLAKSIFKDVISMSSSFSEYDEYALEKGLFFIPRPDKLSSKEVFISDVIRHVAEELKSEHGAKDDDIIVNLDICCPFTQKNHVEEIIRVMQVNKLDSCFTAKAIDNAPIDTNPSCSHDRKSSIFYWPAVRARTIKTAIESSGWGTGERHIDVTNIPEWHIDINCPKDLTNARLLWPIRKRLIS